MLHSDFQTIELPDCKALGQREWMELLQKRAVLLAAEERTLMEMYLDAGLGFRQIARLTGANPSTVARKLRRIARRLANETFFCCARTRWKLGQGELIIIRDHFIRGLSIGQISRSRNVSRYRIGRTIRKARRIATEMCCVTSS